ncbi:MAG: hypothetical protein CL878_00265 [Dehalococcoidia bacterium]|nr:hypothetical protein [Dehalococcoidia bacterium]
MPLASEERVPKPLTYALMYHVVWALLFGATGFGLAILFIVIGHSWQRSFIPPSGLLAFALLSGLGVVALYVIRVQLMTENVEQRTAYRVSQWSNRVVLIFAPAFLLLFRFVLEPLARAVLGISEWPVTAAIASAALQVEVAVWWLSHLLSTSQLSRARRRAGL